MRLEFKKWEAGHHGPYDAPDRLDVNGEGQATEIMEVLRSTLHHKESIEADLVDDNGRSVFRYEVHMDCVTKIVDQAIR